MTQSGEGSREIIRTERVAADFQFLGSGASPEDLRKIKKGLRTLHTLELMAQNIYKFQITAERSEMNRQLIAAMANEMTHYQDFQEKLYEYGWKPDKFRWMYWIVGFFFGFFSRLLGRKAMLKTAVWVETLAVKHYGELLRDIPWDDGSRAVVEKNLHDEEGHVNRWSTLLKAL
mgnify:CR=1 FL=1